MEQKLQAYEKPEVTFESLKLSEKIADTCFGYGNTATYTGVSPALVIETGGCGGNATADAINKAFKAAGIYDKKVNANVCNTKDSQFKSAAAS